MSGEGSLEKAAWRMTATHWECWAPCSLPLNGSAKDGVQVQLGRTAILVSSHAAGSLPFHTSVPRAGLCSMPSHCASRKKACGILGDLGPGAKVYLNTLQIVFRVVVVFLLGMIITFSMWNSAQGYGELPQTLQTEEPSLEGRMSLMQTAVLICGILWSKRGQ